ncbi:6-bladed beta-propeller, partial [candidate division KSB1 bacterium]|nr:6-bladed beta-propeller [candidate division KSB1 bacterium]NIV70271.1 6-bladed beta-propeller [Phycisphaerae bacterium]NIS23469.1 6-bladed beta-propeller [candidate division KSB1 bacterium]NIT70377.1 6-bladed beta-propeller [candidate division KSB1 bacterium]NIU24092.1 6-bladed beta-propeller [candidate division KSB1 bacterium]
IRQFSSEGHEFGQLYYPTDVAVHTDSNILVADAYNHRIQKFSRDGKPLSSWGEKGSGPGQFDVINAVTVDSAE